MKTETIENILTFLKEKEGQEIPKKWVDSKEKFKLIEELENHPDDIQYRHKGNLVLSDSNITKLPNDLYVEGYLNLTNCKQLIKLPDDLYVGGFLSLAYCNQLTKLPNDLYVGGSLNLQNCTQLTKLPDKLYVSGSLGLDETNITEIPNNLYVGHSLFIKNTPLAKKYSNEKIREMITSKGGTIIGNI